MSIESSLDHLIKRANSADRPSAIEAKRSRIFGECGSLQQLLDQTYRVLVLMQKSERAGQINAGQIVLPLVLVILVEVIVQIKNVISGDHTFAREHINRVGNSARIDDV